MALTFRVFSLCFFESAEKDPCTKSVHPRFIYPGVEFKVRRMGGSFGGKLKAPIALTCMAAIGATKHGRPVRIVCDMHTNMNCFGKRLPYYAKYTVSAIKNTSKSFIHLTIEISLCKIRANNT